MIQNLTRVALLLALGVMMAGCAQPSSTPKPAPKSGGEKVAEKKKADHSGWWCQEHGIPEGECSLCLPEAEVKKRFKDLGDWCAIHERAKSQCFKCDPALYKNFEAKYVAKYNAKPEPPPEEEFKK